ncbi:hypothetical protein ACIP4S_09530 [Streptomyces chartreusis]|uniref:hypothetical protein n=1 Tax=Streptomyces chartreusis TaxID=1969 RepID=UPI00380F5089
MSERMKPPARRTGRALGGAKKTATPPPPPTAELTPERYAAEQATAQKEGHPTGEPAQDQSAAFSVPVETSARGGIEAAPMPPQPTVESMPGGSGSEPPASPAMRSNVAASNAETGVSRATGMRQLGYQPSAAEPAAPEARAAQPAELDARHTLAHLPSATPDPAAAAVVAVRRAATAVAGGTAFPVRSGGPASHHEQSVGSEAAPSKGASWAHGPGRPKNIPETAVILNQRIITRESLDSSVPAALKLKKRIKRFALDNELDHLPMGDIVAVALDEWLTTRGF